MSEARDFEAVRQRVEAYALDRPEDAVPFSARVRRECGWSAVRTARAIAEYRRFLILAACAGHRVTPPREVDLVWHLHLTDTRRYWGEFCPQVLGFPLHHDPNRGSPAETARLDGLYAATLASYERLFGEAPPLDIWPPRGGKKRRFSFAPLLRLAPLSAVLLTLGCTSIYDSSSPGGMQGPEFLQWYGILAVWALAGTLVLQTVALHRHAQPRVDPATLGPYELAYLAGRGGRVLTTALLRLHRRRIIQIDAKSTDVTVLQPLPPDAPAIETTLVEAIRQDRRWNRMRNLAAPLAALDQKLAAAGLVPSAELRGNVWTVTALVIVPVLLLGLLRLAFGIANDKPVAFLVMELVALAVVTLMATVIRLKSTAEARRILIRIRDTTPRKPVGVIGDEALTLGVALWGVVALPGTGYDELKGFLNRVNPSSSDGGGGGCSGGGCGGGGCGG